MLTRPLPSSPKDVTANPLKATVCGQGPASYLDWLTSLKRGDTVRVRQSGGDVMPPAMVTNETPRYVFIGKLKFRRGDGWQVKRNASRCYRMRLRLVRDKEDMQ